MSLSKQRYSFIDLFRFTAGFFMIQGHVFDAMLNTQVKAASWYYIHDFLHGFIAPMFLFASGVAYGVSTIRKWEEHIVWGERVRRRIGKFLALMAIGYALHLPYFSLWKTITGATSPEIKSLMQVDALQCIAVTLLILQASVLLLRDQKVFVCATGIVAGIIILSSPFMWSFHFGDTVPHWLSAYFNAENGSWFPLFPWSAYILSGVVFGYFLLNARNHRQELSMMLKYVSLIAGLALLAQLTLRLPIVFYPPHDYWKSDPSIILIRLCAVSIVALGIYLAERSFPLRTRIPSIMGKETLFVYIVHLLVVYGSVMGPGMSHFVGRRLSLTQTIGVTALVYTAVMLLTVVWYDLNSKHRTVAERIKFAAAALFLLAFVVKPW